MLTFRRDFRKHLPVGDLDFIAGLLSDGPGQSEALFKLLTDPQTVDAILDQPRLLDALLDRPDHLPISSRLYFYLITRHSLKRAGLDDPELADYVSGVLDSQLHRPRGGGAGASLFYLVDWLKDLERQPRDKHFQLYVMAGNTLLFLTGIFPNRIRERRRRRGAPGLEFYEDFGRFSFESAARSARGTLEDDALFLRIAARFSQLRGALNDASERLLHLEDPA